MIRVLIQQGNENDQSVNSSCKFPRYLQLRLIIMATIYFRLFQKQAHSSQYIHWDYLCLLAQLLPDMENLSGGDYIFMQDGARSHTSKVTLTYLQEHCHELLKPDFWPPNSPDLNPCDYAVWGTLEANIWNHRRNQITTLEDLKQRIVEEWDALSQDFINNSINSFRKRVRMVVERNGGHIEKYL